jgi:hypothetical protein
LWAKAQDSQMSSHRSKRDEASDLFQDQFTNPKEIMAIMLLIGGDVIQRAIAQLVGGTNATFTPVAFSFGWVTYAFSSVANAVGDGTFLPQPEYPSIVVNASSGDRRDNQSWALGRLNRDLELEIESRYSEAELGSGLIVSVFKAVPDGPSSAAHQPRRDWLWWSFSVVWICQFVLAGLPIMHSSNWSIILVMTAGNLLAVITASLPALSAEKYQGRKHSKQTYAITRGNGHKLVFLIMPDTLEVGEHKVPISSLPHLDEMASGTHRAGPMTRIFSVILAILWVMLLVTIGGLDSDTWFLFGAGLLGMGHNILVSAWPRSPAAHGIPIEAVEDGIFGIIRPNEGKQGVMDVLISLEKKFPGAGHSLRPVFFPGRERLKDSNRWLEPDVSKETIKDRQALISDPIGVNGAQPPPGGGEQMPAHQTEV